MIENKRKEVASKDFDERFKLLESEGKIISNVHVAFAKTEDEENVEALIHAETNVEGMFNTIEMLVNICAEMTNKKPSNILSILAMKKLVDELEGENDDEE